jgi:type I restriction enzyme M protein
LAELYGLFDVSRVFASRPDGEISSETAYVLMVYEHLSARGTAAIIVPNGVLFRSGLDQRIRMELVEQGAVHAVISLPARLFAPATMIETSILVLRRPDEGHTDAGTLFIDARELGTRQGPKVVFDEKAVDQVLNTYRERRSELGFSKVTGKSEVEAKSYSLIPSNYVEQAAATKIDEPFRRAQIAELDEKHETLLAEYETLRAMLAPEI